MTKDRYRPLFCKPDYYLDNQSLFKVWKTRFACFSDADKVKAWTIALTCLRRPKDWFGGKRSAPIDLDASFEKSNIELETIFIDSPLIWPDSVNSKVDLQSFLNLYRIKPLPEAAHRGLYNLGTKNYPLIITHLEPSPFELLKIQIDGLRVITFEDDIESWPTKIYGSRDVLSFIIHDLIHADHFFKDEKQRQGQIGFYKLIQKIKDDSALQNLLRIEKFRSGFEYIISDMNAHPLHLFQTLKALLDLSGLGEQQILMVWKTWVTIWGLIGLEADAVHKINTELFSNINAHQIESICFKKSLETGLAISN